MLTWLIENAVTILVGAILLAVVVAILAGMIKNRGSGGSCSCGCAGCANSEYCRGSEKTR